MYKYEIFELLFIKKYINNRNLNITVPLRIIESNKGGLCLVDSNLHIFTRINTKLTTGPITWSCVNKKYKHIK